MMRSCGTGVVSTFGIIMLSLGFLTDAAGSLLTHSTISKGQTPNPWWRQGLLARLLCECPAVSVRLEGYLGNKSRE